MTKINLYEIIRQNIAEGRPLAQATVITSPAEKQVIAGAKLLVFAHNTSLAGSLGDSDLDRRVAKDALQLLRQEKSRTIIYEFEAKVKIEVFIESLLPPTPLVIFGGDPDAIPIVGLGKQFGFRVILVDHREQFANREKYPHADSTIVSATDKVAEEVHLDDRTFVLVKTHNYLRDKEILTTALKSSARYVGQLGPKARTEDLLRDLRDEGTLFSEKELQRFYAPVGLDIGAESPDQIALSIFSEILAVKNGRMGSFLREQTWPIHPRD